VVDLLYHSKAVIIVESDIISTLKGGPASVRTFGENVRRIRGTKLTFQQAVTTPARGKMPAFPCARRIVRPTAANSICVRPL